MADMTPAFTLRALRDAPLPAAPDWTPQTPACYLTFAVLALIVVALVLLVVRRFRARRYRRAALAELEALGPQAESPQSRPAALLALATLLKRCALAVRPREAVAPLSGEAWRAWLAASGRVDIELERHIYGPPLPPDGTSSQTLRELQSGARRWIVRHSRKPARREKQ